jgi:predicted ATPase/class 3 adenylate cyclase
VDSGQAATFLFTDIEASTRRWEHDAVAMSAALARHDELVRAAVGAAGGTIVKHTGDGVVAVFTRPADALRAAVAVQRGLSDDDVRVRAGLHTGPAEERDGDYFGPTLNRAARIMALGRGGHVLLSATTAGSIVRGSLDEVALLDLGEHPLKGFEQRERVFQAVGPGLNGDRALDAPESVATRGSRNAFIGRETEIEAINRLLAEGQCVTLTGVGGTGKTRLALEVARRTAAAYADGIAVAELAPLADPDAVPRAIADAVAMPVVATSIARDLAIFLRDRELLLVLDNCEHLLDACADLVDEIVDACPRVTVLATSREPLGLEGERSWRAPSLSMPSDDVGADPLGCESAALFTARAEVARPGFVAAEHGEAIGAICRGLDGLPLAIELAAARTAHLTPEQIAEMLDDRFRLLTGGARRARQRQQTLQAAMDWSHDLLRDDEQQLLRRLSVFAGGWTLDAAVAVCGGGDPVSVIDGLGSLVAKSLVVADETDAGMRYRMLETVRLYAQDRLVEAGEAEELRTRHRDWFLEHAGALRAAFGAQWVSTFARSLDVERDNLRVALDWSEEHGRGDLVVRLVVATWPMWYVRLRAHEARARLDRYATAVDEQLPLVDRVEWRVARGFLLQEAMDGAGINRAGEEALALDPDGTASELTGLAWFLRLMLPVFVDPPAGAAIATEALDWVDRHSPPAIRELVEGYATNALISNRNWEQARERLRGIVDEDETDPFLDGWVRNQHATVALLLGDVDEALTSARELAARVTPTSGRHLDVTAHAFLAIAESACGDAVASRRTLAAATDAVRRRYAHIPSAWGIPITAAGIILAADGRDLDAMRLLVAVGAHGRLWHARQETMFVLHREQSRIIADRLGPEAVQRAWAEGEAMTVDEVIASVDALVTEP